MKSHHITLIPGDGIGPEVANATKRVLEATGVRIQWEVHDAGAAIAETVHRALQRHRSRLIRCVPDEVHEDVHADAVATRTGSPSNCRAQAIVEAGLPSACRQRAIVEVGFPSACRQSA